MVQTRTFPGFASLTAFADYARFIADHHARVRRLALVTDSALAPWPITSSACRCGHSRSLRTRRQ